MHGSGTAYCVKFKSECQIKEHKLRDRHENCREGLFNLRKTSPRLMEVNAVPLVGGLRAVQIFEDNYPEWSVIDQSNPTYWNAKLRKELSPKKKANKKSPASKRKPPQNVPPSYLSHTKKHEGFSIFAPPPDTPSPPEESGSPDDDSSFHSDSVGSYESPVFEVDAEGIPRMIGVTRKSDIQELAKSMAGEASYPYKRREVTPLKINIPGDRPNSLMEAAAVLNVKGINLPKQVEALNEVLVKSAELCDVRLVKPMQLPEMTEASYKANLKLVKAMNTTWSTLGQNAATLLTLSNALKKVDERTYHIFKHLTRFDEKGQPVELMPGNVWESIDKLKVLSDTYDRSIKELTLKNRRAEVTANADRESGKKLEKEASEALKTVLSAHTSLRSFEEKFNNRFALLEAAQKATANRVDTASNKSPTASNDDVTALRGAVATSLKTNEAFAKQVQILEGKVAKLSEQLATSHQVPDASTIEDRTFEVEMRRNLDALGRKVDANNQRVAVIEEATDRASVSYVIGSDTVRSASDVEALLSQSGIVDWGLMPSVIDIFIFIYEQGTGKSDSIKQRKLIQELGMSDYEGKVLANCDQLFPAVLCSSKSDLSSTFGQIPVSEWRSKTELRDGVAHELEARLEKFLYTLESAISTHYDSGAPQDLMWSNISKNIVRDSCHFITLLIRYIDSMLDFLTVAGGHKEEASWGIIMKAVRRIFEEHFAAARGLPVGILPEASSSPAIKRRFRARMIWNALHSHQLVKEMNAARIRRHPLIEGAYSEWVLTHSGRSEAITALSTTDRMNTYIKKLQSTIASLEKSVADAQSLAKGAKSAADRAVSRQGTTPGKEKQK